MVFDVMNTLVREVPTWLAPNLDQNKVITFKTIDRDDETGQRDYFFMKMHYVEEMMTKIANTPGVKIYFYSGDQQYLVDSVLKSLKLVDGTKRSFYDLVQKPKKHILYRGSSVDTWDEDKAKEMVGKYYDKTKRWKKDLTKLGVDVENTVFISPIDKAALNKKQNESILFLGEPFFYAKSYADAKYNFEKRAEEIKTKPWVADNYPKSKEEWENDFFKNAFVYLVLSEILPLEVDFQKELQKRLAEDRNYLTKAGMMMLDNTWKDEQHHFILNSKKDKVVGCQLMENRHRRVISSSGISDCIEDNEVAYDWIYQKDRLEVDQCVLRDGTSGALIEVQPLADCIENKDTVNLWKGNTQNQCAYYTDNLYYITQAKSNKCSDNQHVIYHQDTDRNIKVKYFSGMEKLSIEEILAKISFQTTISLTKFNSKPQVMSGIRYPRVDHIMYRGMDSRQMSLEKTFRAIWGDLNAVVESKVVTILKSYLMGKGSPVADNYSPINLRNLAAEILKKKAGPYNEEKALRVAIETLDKELQKRGDVALRNELVDQYSGSFNEWGGAGLYTAPFYNVAKLYGTNVVVFRERKPRGVDKTYFQFMKYNSSNWPRVDSGEYIIPLYIPANEIEGMHLSRSYVMYSTNPWGEAFYKVEYNNKPFVIAIDPQRQQCVQKEEDGLVYYCDDNYVSSAFPLFPTKKGQVEAKAILALCPEDESCSLPSGIAKKFKLQGSELGYQTLSKISSMKLFGKKIKVFYKDATIDADDSITD